MSASFSEHIEKDGGSEAEPMMMTLVFYKCPSKKWTTHRQAGKSGRPCPAYKQRPGQRQTRAERPRADTSCSQGLSWPVFYPNSKPPWQNIDKHLEKADKTRCGQGGPSSEPTRWTRATHLIRQDGDKVWRRADQAIPRCDPPSCASVPSSIFC